MRAAPRVSVPIHTSPSGARRRLCTAKPPSPASCLNTMPISRRSPRKTPASVAAHTDPSERGFHNFLHRSNVGNCLGLVGDELHLGIVRQVRDANGLAELQRTGVGNQVARN